MNKFSGAGCGEDASYEAFLEVEARFRAVAAPPPRIFPGDGAGRAEIARLAADCLGVREALVPRQRVETALETTLAGVRVQCLRSESWDGCAGAAHLYLPEAPAAGPLPAVIICWGHGAEGKKSPAYRLMARRLARAGAAVLVPDNIGQGERVPMGHRDVIGPFHCGLSLQGLIVMEAIAWLRWLLSDGRFDPRRIAAAGNSGGGTLTLFLAAFCRDQLAALSSSGYPSYFEFVAAKEKDHCHCNILPGVIGRLEMWQLYGSFAPGPLFLFQGREDCLFPEDLFHRLAREVSRAYRAAGAPGAFRARVFPGGHRWDGPRREALGDFLGGVLGLKTTGRDAEEEFEAPPDCYPAWPSRALSADDIAARLSGVRTPPPEALFRVYRPDLEKFPDIDFPRVGMRQLAAQMEAFLAPDRRFNR